MLPNAPKAAVAPENLPFFIVRIHNDLRKDNIQDKYRQSQIKL
jgi:hypothetical protein